MTIPRSIVGVYAVLCVFGLFILESGTFGWFGIERNPLSVAFAALFAMPWMLLFTSQEFGRDADECRDHCVTWLDIAINAPNTFGGHAWKTECLIQKMS